MIFQHVFWAFKPCIDAQRYTKPIIEINGTHLYAKYKGILLIITTQDVDSGILPLAFAIMENETNEAWMFFLNHLRLHFVKRRQGVCLISCRHPSILAATIVTRLMW